MKGVRLRRLMDAGAEVVSELPGGARLRKWYAHRAPIHVISYPKSGRTWLRFVLGQIFVDHLGLRIERPAETLEIHRLARLDSRVPVMRFSHDDNPHLRRVDPVSDKAEYRGKMVIFLSRDPRDIVVSSYYQHSRREPWNRFEGSIEEFLRHPVFGIENAIRFMNLWASRRNVPRRFLLVRYEDMLEEMEREVRRLLTFVQVPNVDEDVIRLAVSMGEFQNMQALERNDALGSAALRPGDPNDADSYKVRRGGVGGYRKELSPEDCLYLDRLVAEELDPFFGYEQGDTPSENTTTG